MIGKHLIIASARRLEIERKGRVGNVFGMGGGRGGGSVGTRDSEGMR
jgi:hypothetical protein